MQQINHWPKMTTLNLLESVAQDLHRHLLEPFANVIEAKQFWKEAPSTIIILEPTDSIKELQESEAWNQIQFALTYPEYTVELKLDYQLLVAIANDSGAGIYLVIPPESTHIIPEAKTHE